MIPCICSTKRSGICPNVLLERCYSDDVYYVQNFTDHRSVRNTPLPEPKVDEIVPGFLNKLHYSQSFHLKKAVISNTIPSLNYSMVPSFSQSTRDLSPHLFSEHLRPAWRVSFLQCCNYKFKIISSCNIILGTNYFTTKNNIHEKWKSNYFYLFQTAFKRGLPSTRVKFLSCYKNA